jgi:hypothetical protein
VAARRAQVDCETVPNVYWISAEPGRLQALLYGEHALEELQGNQILVHFYKADLCTCATAQALI